MGNKLTVTNLSQNEIIVRVNVNHIVLEKMNAGVQVTLPSTVPTISSGLNLSRKDDDFGSVAVSPGNAWTFPMITGRYRVTITKSDGTGVLCERLEVPWHTDISVTSDYQLSSVNPKNEYEKKHRSTLNQLKKSTGVPRFIAKLFVPQLTSEEEAKLDEITQHIITVQSMMASKLKEHQTCVTKTHVDTNVLKSVLEKEPFDMAPDDVNFVLETLSSSYRRRKKLAKLLFKLTDTCSNTSATPK